jgi:hypothetical protein
MIQLVSSSVWKEHPASNVAERTYLLDNLIQDLKWELEDMHIY